MKSTLFTLLFALLFSCAANAQTAAGAPFRKGDTFDLRLSGMDAEFAQPFAGTYTVDDQGMINLPMVGRLKVEGFLPNQVQDSVQNLLIGNKIFTHPIAVVQSNSVRFVNVTGEVKSPQRVQYTPDMTFLTAISACSGFTDYADKKHIRLIRDGKTQMLNAVEIQDNPSRDIKVLPGDLIIIKQSFL